MSPEPDADKWETGLTFRTGTWRFVPNGFRQFLNANETGTSSSQRRWTRTGPPGGADPQEGFGSGSGSAETFLEFPSGWNLRVCFSQTGSMVPVRTRPGSDG